MTTVIPVDIGDVVLKIVKSPKCCIKECDSYGTKGVCGLKMCDKHHNQATD